ncbi:MAG TPA: RraA family protein [Thermoanaerobaculia bacterium]
MTTSLDRPAVDLLRVFERLTTPLIADACLRRGVALRLAPPGLSSVVPGWRTAGLARPARHVGSVDVFLEAIGLARRGDVLVVDNGGRRDEGCVGDLTALEARMAELAGILIWGSHRDSAELEGVGLPVFSYGAFPAGPRKLDPRPPDALRAARFGDVTVTADDAVFADADGALFVESERVEEVLEAAFQIGRAERSQASEVEGGRSLREQLAFPEFLARRAADPSWSFRAHLRRRGGAIEE